MKRTARRATVAAVAVAGGLALAACQPLPGAAAVVGNQRITTDQLSSSVQIALDNSVSRDVVNGDRVGYERQQLSHLILHRLLTDAAGRLHVSVTSAQVDAALASTAQANGGLSALQLNAAQNGVPPQQLRDYIADNVLAQAIGDKLTADVPVPQSKLAALYQQHIDSYDQVHAAHILVKDKPTADRILTAVRADPSRFAALARKYSIDTGSKNSGGDLGFQGPSAFVKPFSDAVFAAPVGSFIEVHSQYGWHVVHVIARHTQTLAEVTPALRRQLLTTQSQQQTTAYLTQLAHELGVRVSPRYGRYDVGNFSVVSATPNYLTPLPSKPAAPQGPPAPGD